MRASRRALPLVWLSQSLISELVHLSSTHVTAFLPSPPHRPPTSHVPLIRPSPATRPQEMSETVHQLDVRLMEDAGYGAIKTPTRHVRTRLYFTSESHVHAVVNTLKYWGFSPLGGNAAPPSALSQPSPSLRAASGEGDDGAGMGGDIAVTPGRRSGRAPSGGSDGGAAGVDDEAHAAESDEQAQHEGGSSGSDGGGGANASGDVKLVSDEGLAMLDATPELDYLTHIVFRL